MPIFFGWGRQTINQIGIVFKNLCNHCNNEEFWTLTKITTWFTLFFIPIIPYSIKYFFSCPICKYGLELNQKQIEQIKPLAEINQLLIDGKITQEEHQIRLNQLTAGDKTTTETTKQLGSDTNLVEIKEKKLEISYCGKCGNKIETDLKFCVHCGAKISKL